MNRKQKKRGKIQALVNGIVTAYEETGASTDPLGMYTGVTREVRDPVPGAYTVSAIPDARTPANAVADGKRYVSEASFAASASAAEPVQDVDDL